MHVVMFGDQHVESLGGAQVSMRLQRRFLERAGHTVTIVAPAMHGARGRAATTDAVYLDLPSIPITLDREYSLTWPGVRTDRYLDAAMADRAPVDLVHVQADFWGAFTGHRYAARHGLPVVHTMHNRVDVGIEATAPAPRLVLRALNFWQRRALHVPGQGRDGWDYLRQFARLSRSVTAPSSHFAHRLEAHGAVPPGPNPHVDVVWNGIDDDVLDAALAAGREARRPGPARLVWIGRMSPEKRLLPFLEAVAASGAHVEVEVIGGGGQWRAAQRTAARAAGAAASVRFVGRLTYLETLRRIAAADAVVQTSIGFETQGMTPFEGASLGTPAIVCDPDIANELGSGVWRVGDGVAADESVDALAAAIRAAAADVEAGTAPVPAPDIGERFRQSSRTAAMIEIYRRASAA
ncbi:glycosyltransferase involved in cell wall biosynthesis [Microbacterium endophyticum]|uniref:D-inositol 3-phosphate glycosyltransferase n=1 Tax=Microbacterium endophyticum TaxID=1526412 RepID=A0A7W4V4Q0_9MICO|nr:glycosyltransferase family 4 protein [Microbacterium endophyticum]MBB2976832.1 glycosyltransferase involved in cell wall biosynthesis [Microbacterium endophyticum]NIK35850.1 glycosyltransferase involved in cell wall biosynthesis [Microbacterium endophyticum]